MADETFLCGKVRRIRLQVFTQPTGPDAPVLKRLLLPQGELAQFHDGDEGMRYMAFIELKVQGVRGNHYHERKREFIYVTSGRLDLVVEDTADKSRAIVVLVAGDLAAIETNVAHALLTVEPGHAIEFSPQRFDPADTFRYPLVPQPSDGGPRPSDPGPQTPDPGPQTPDLLS